MTTRLELSGQAARDHPNQVAYLDPASNPILLLAQRRKSEQSLNLRFDWEDEHKRSHYNEVQIFRDAFGMNSADQDDRDRLDIEKGAEHALGIERAFLFGERQVVQLDDPPGPRGSRRYTGGVLSWEATIEGSTGGEPTQAEIESWSERAIGRLVLTGAWMRTYVDIAADKGLHSVPLGQSYGIPVVQWIMARGTTMFTKHRLLTGPTQWIALYPKHLGYRWFRDTAFIERTWAEQHAGVDAELPPEPEGWMLHEYITEAGLEFAEPGDIHVLKK